MKIIRLLTGVFARFCISLVFLSGAVNTILHWHEMEGSLMSLLSEWTSNLGSVDLVQEYISLLIPYSPLLLTVATAFELVGAFLVLLGIKEKLGATLLILFLLPVTVVMHAFWLSEGPGREVQMVQFLKNLAILGGLLVIVLRGTDAEPQPPRF